MTRSRKKTNARAAAANPRLTPLQQFLLQEARREIRIRVDGKEHLTSVGDVVARKLLSAAASGSAHALGHSLYALNEAQRLEQARIDHEVEIGIRFRNRQAVKLREVIASGGDPETVLPHPDDIEVIHGQGYRVTGPWDENELEAIRQTCRMRDVMLIQHALEEAMLLRKHEPKDPEDVFEQPGALALVVVHYMNSGLPARYAKTDEQLYLEMKRLRAVTKRDLLKTAYRAWRSIGRPKPRGWMMPRIPDPETAMQQLVAESIHLLKEVSAGRTFSSRQLASWVERTRKEIGIKDRSRPPGT